MDAKYNEVISWPDSFYFGVFSIFFYSFFFTKIKPRLDLCCIFTWDRACSSFCRFMAVFKLGTTETI